MISRPFRGLPFSTYAPRGEGGGGSTLLYISIAYYMQKGGGEGVQIAGKIAYLLNGRPLTLFFSLKVYFDDFPTIYLIFLF